MRKLHWLLKNSPVNLIENVLIGFLRNAMPTVFVFCFNKCCSLFVEKVLSLLMEITVFIKGDYSNLKRSKTVVLTIQKL